MSSISNNTLFSPIPIRRIDIKQIEGTEQDVKPMDIDETIYPENYERKGFDEEITEAFRRSAPW